MKQWKIGLVRTVCAMAAVVMALAVLTPKQVFADGTGDGSTDTAGSASVDGRPFLALGADLKASERKTVLGLLGVTEQELEQFDVIEVTNQQEHQYLGDYLPSSVIGSRALSSVLVRTREDGYGISVVTKNINYCTQGMYCNALITAGVENADVTVAGPFPITGTAALIGAMEAYSVMTGEALEEEAMDAAINELVLTGEVAESTGDSDKTEELMAALKQEIANGNLESPEEIRHALSEAANTLNLQLSEDQKERIASYMDKFSELDIDPEALKNQAKDLYEKIKNLDLNFGDGSEGGLFQGIVDFFANLFKSIADFFANLF